MIRKFLITILCVSILFGCSHNSSNVPSIKITENFVSHIAIEELFGEVTYLTFSSNAEMFPIIGNITGAFVSREYIYISDSRSIYIIDKNGSLKNTIHRYGRSLQEYMGISDFCVQNDEYIYILDKNKRILKYTNQGDYMASSELEYYPASIDILDEDKLILTSAYQSDEEKFIIYDCETLNLQHSFVPINRNQITWRHIYGQSNFYKRGEEILFHEPMNNTIFQIDESGVTPKYSFDLFGRNISEKFLNGHYSSIMEANIEAEKNAFCFGLPIYSETDEEIWFTYRDGSHYRICKYDKESKCSVQSDSLNFTGISLSIPISNIFLHSESDSEQIIVLTGDMIKSTIKEKILNVPESYDNLIFVLKNS